MQESIEDYLRETIFNVSSLSDLKSICKSRGFQNPIAKGEKSGWEVSVYSFFMSTLGLLEVFSTLDKNEILVLHYLCAAGGGSRPIEEVCTFFCSHKCIQYGGKELRQTFTKIKDGLISKGIVLVKTDPRRYRDLKLAQYNILFPQEFWKFLPPLTISKKINIASDFSSYWTSFVGERLLKLFQNEEYTFPFPEISLPVFSLKDGSLLLQQKLYPAIEEVYQAFLEQWLLCRSTLKAHSFSNCGERNIQRSKVRKYILKSIPEGQGFIKEDFARVMQDLFFDFKDNEIDAFVEAGCLLGFLEKKEQDGSEYFIPHFNIFPTESTQPFGVHDEGDRVSLVLKKKFSLSDFFCLAGISSITIENKKLFLRPCCKQIGRKYATLIENPCIQKVQQESRNFQKAFQLVKKQEGKVVMHQNMKVIKLNSLDCKATILASFAEVMIDLSDGYYAVAEEHLSEILTHSKKKGFIPKHINTI